jgi:hypothetical protein
MIYKRNLNTMEWMEMGHGERFFHQRKSLTPFDQPHMPKLGISLYRLQPGRSRRSSHTSTRSLARRDLSSTRAAVHGEVAQQRTAAALEAAGR